MEPLLQQGEKVAFISLPEDLSDMGRLNNASDSSCFPGDISEELSFMTSPELRVDGVIARWGPKVWVDHPVSPERTDHQSC